MSSLEDSQILYITVNILIGFAMCHNSTKQPQEKKISGRHLIIIVHRYSNFQIILVLPT